MFDSVFRKPRAWIICSMTSEMLGAPYRDMCLILRRCCWTWPVIKTVNRSLIEKSRIAKVSEKLDEMSQITQVRYFKDVCDLVLSNRSSQSRIDAEQFSLIYFRKISGPRSPIFFSKLYYWSFDEEGTEFHLGDEK